MAEHMTFDFGNAFFKSNSILDYLPDGSAMVYIEKPGESLWVKPIYASTSFAQSTGGVPQTLVGFEFLRSRGGEQEPIPKTEFRPVSGRVLARLTRRSSLSA